MKGKCLFLLIFYCKFSLGLVPTGQTKGPFKHYSKIYPGTKRNYWLYIPPQ